MNKFKTFPEITFNQYLSWNYVQPVSIVQQISKKYIEKLHRQHTVGKRLMDATKRSFFYCFQEIS